MSLNNYLFTAAISLVFGIAGGVAANYYLPVPAQIAIIDTAEMLKLAVPKGRPATEADANLLADKVKNATQELVKQGVVIIDAQAVLGAPEEAYVHID